MSCNVTIMLTKISDKFASCCMFPQTVLFSCLCTDEGEDDVVSMPFFGVSVNRHGQNNGLLRHSHSSDVERLPPRNTSS